MRRRFIKPRSTRGGRVRYLGKHHARERPRSKPRPTTYSTCPIKSRSFKYVKISLNEFIIMTSLSTAREPSEVCGTLHAAKLLGLSVGTVQALVERGELRAWKTRGGHRRIYLESLTAFQQANGLKVTNRAAPPSFRMLVVDDDPVFLALVRQASTSWQLDVECITSNSAIEALMNVRTLQPKLLLTDLHMPKIDGYDFIRQLRSDEQCAHIHIMAVTAMNKTQVVQSGDLPQGVILMTMPLDMRWLHGYVAALTTLR